MYKTHMAQLQQVQYSHRMRPYNSVKINNKVHNTKEENVLLKSVLL